MKIRLRLWIGLFFCLLSVAFFLANSWPARRSLSQFEVADRGFLDPTESSQTQPLGDHNGMVVLPASYSISLDLPANLRVGEPEPVRLSVQQKGALIPSSPLSGLEASVEGSLSFPDLDFRPAGSIYERLRTDHPANFVWFLTGSAKSTEPGTLWLYLIFHSAQGGESTRVLVLARPLSFEISAPFGIPGYVFRIAGWVSLIIGGWLGIGAGLPGLIKKFRKA